MLRVLGAELGVEFPVEELTSKLGPPLDQILAPHLPADQVGPAGDRFRALYPEHAVADIPVLPGAHEALAAVRRHRGRVVVVTGKYPPNAQRHIDHLALDVDLLEGWVWGVGKAEVLRREGVSVYVGDHVHDVEGARAAGVLSVSVLTGGCTREELEDGRDRRGAREPRGVPRVARRAPAARPGSTALERDLRARGSRAWSPTAAARTARSCSRRRSARSDPTTSSPRPATAHSLPEVERDPARDFAESLGVEVLTPETHEMEREGYRANGGDRCFFCKAELIDVLTPLARGARHRRPSRPARTPTTRSPASGRASAPPTSAARSHPLRDAGLTKAQVREASHRWGLPTWDKPAAACLSSRVAYGVEVTPHRLARVERAEAAVRELLAADGLANLRVRDLGRPRLGRGRPRTAAARRAPRTHEVVAAVRGGGLRRGRRRREGVPLRVDERALA